MHEMSIADALFEQVLRHMPADSTVLSVRVEAGALQCLDEQAFQWAWTAVTDGTELHGTKLELHMLPYDVTCPRCGRHWQSPEALVQCTCGVDGNATGTAELRLLSLEVEPTALHQEAKPCISK